MSTYAVNFVFENFFIAQNNPLLKPIVFRNFHENYLYSIHSGHFFNNNTMQYTVLQDVQFSALNRGNIFGNFNDFKQF